jgi:hypothetical protein
VRNLTLFVAQRTLIAADNLIYAAGLIGPSNIFGDAEFGGVAGVG